MCVFVAWGALAEVPLYVAANEARIVVRGEAIKLGAPVRGQIEAVAVEVGQKVEAGDVLVSMQAEALVAELAQVEEEIALLDAIAGETAAEIEAFELLAEKQRAVAGTDLAEAEALVDREEALRAQARRESLRAKRLEQAGIIPKSEAEEALRDARTQHADFEAFKARAKRAELLRHVTNLELDSGINRLRRERLGYLVELHQRESRQIELRNQIRQRKVRAPVAGTVGAVRSYAPGVVLEYSSGLVTLIPNEELRVVAYFPPDESLGWLRAGQPAEIQLRGYPSTQFGTLSARVAMVSEELEDQQLRAELVIENSDAFPVELQHGLPGNVQVEVSRTSPIGLLRTAGQLVGRESHRPPST